jgi:hypothetical protein
VVPLLIGKVLGGEGFVLDACAVKKPANSVTHGAEIRYLDGYKIPYLHLRTFNRKAQRCGLHRKSLIVGAGSAQK